VFSCFFFSGFSLHGSHAPHARSRGLKIDGQPDAKRISLTTFREALLSDFANEKFFSARSGRMNFGKCSCGSREREEAHDTTKKRG